MGIFTPLSRQKYRINLNKKNLIQDKEISHFDKTILEETLCDIYLGNWWQSYKYVEIFEADYSHKFSFMRKCIGKESEEIASSLEGNNSFSTQVRLNDYVEDSSISKICNVLKDIIKIA